ncbi:MULTISPECIES: phenylacetate--CoA ligase family protein [Calothrix]|uniref:Phenylacetate-coenzyme A ligase n=2 Tax=Calothrix TaxID=1186 RepID=A0ABR8A407_9CYAN|nr:MULTISPECIES: phenylacetate--CoA ligase [Calothrix]MBD2194658.1 phenylacetate--CoA ligase [Calothrix parietina FACHB-288]MBD2229914.1 phenylacetate--CoA ligase [Calothrix anomala FACHB-343]
MNKLALEPYIWNRKYESMPREDLSELQSNRLIKCVARAYEHIPFYKQKLDAVGIHPSQIRSVDNISLLPFTTKADLRNQYPFGMFAVQMDSIIRLHASSGTTGKPTVVGYTHNDLNLWSELTARALAASGAKPGIIIQNTYGYSLATGGLGFHYGIERIGATVVPASGSSPQRNLTLLQDFSSGIILSTPSYIYTISEVAENEGIDLRLLPVAAGIFGAESWSEALRDDIEQRWNIVAYNTYGLSEVIGPGVAHECPHRVGMHIYEDHFIPEIINPETGEKMEEGIYGELVLTTITKEATPLIRYRTGDITRLFYEPCACGRTLVRMDRVKGRINDLIIIKNKTLFPAEIEDVLLKLPGIIPHYQIVIDDNINLIDDIEIWVEVLNSIWQEQTLLVELEQQLRFNFEHHLRIAAKVKLMPPQSLPRSEGKAKRLVNRSHVI